MQMTKNKGFVVQVFGNSTPWSQNGTHQQYTIVSGAWVSVF